MRAIMQQLRALFSNKASHLLSPGQPGITLGFSLN